MTSKHQGSLGTLPSVAALGALSHAADASHLGTGASCHLFCFVF